MVVFDVASVVAEIADALCDRGVAGQHRAGVAVGTQVLAGIEAGAGDGPKAAGRHAVPARALGLGRIFDERDFRVRDECLEALHRRNLAVQVHRHQCPRVGADPRGDALRIDEQRVRSRVSEHHRRARAAHCESAGDERVGWNHDLVAGPDPDRAQREFQRVGAVRHADAVCHLAEPGEVGLESRHLLAEHEARRLQHSAPACGDFVRDLGVLGRQIDQRHLQNGVRHRGAPVSRWR
jgi:hypothetical protein